MQHKSPDTTVVRATSIHKVGQGSHTSVPPMCKCNKYGSTKIWICIVNTQPPVFKISSQTAPHQRTCVVFALHRFFLPDVISSTPSVHPDSSSYSDTNDVVTDCEPEKRKKIANEQRKANEMSAYRVRVRPLYMVPPSRSQMFLTFVLTLKGRS